MQDSYPNCGAKILKLHFSLEWPSVFLQFNFSNFYKHKDVTDQDKNCKNNVFYNNITPSDMNSQTSAVDFHPALLQCMKKWYI